MDVLWLISRTAKPRCGDARHSVPGARAAVVLARPRAVPVWILIVAVGLGFSGGVPANKDNDQLRALRSRLKTLQEELESTREERDQSKTALRDVERRIGQQHRRLKELESEHAALDRQLASLRNDQTKQRQAIRGQVRALGREARTAYVLGQQEYLKLLLNQEDPARVSRALTYHRYLQQARVERISAARTTLDKLLELDSQVSQRQEQLKALRDRQREERGQLESARQQRSAILAKVERRLADQTQELQRLKEDEQRLSQVVKRVRRFIEDVPISPPEGVNGRFAENRGKLSLPVQGSLIARYGNPKNIGDLRWRGVFLATPEGREVRSVFRGRVAYADWLRGFGLLLILEHGDGYMTLYGHNQTLYKEVGDWVEAGQLIAATGATGGPPQPGLYFEIRHNGETRDPLQWCRAR